jgi:hypothetical protein
MKRLLAAFLSALLLLGCAGCGNLFVSARWNGGINQSTTGLVVLVDFSSFFNNGTFVVITWVTLQKNGTSTTILPFCGDQRSQFPVNQFVNASFTPGQPCNQIVNVATGPQ